LRGRPRAELDSVGGVEEEEEEEEED